MEGEDSTPQMALAGHLLVPSDGNNGTTGPVFGHQMGSEASSCQSNDGSRLALESSFDGGDSYGVSRISRSDNL